METRGPVARTGLIHLQHGTHLAARVPSRLRCRFERSEQALRQREARAFGALERLAEARHDGGPGENVARRGIVLTDPLSIPVREVRVLGRRGGASRDVDEAHLPDTLVTKPQPREHVFRARAVFHPVEHERAVPVRRATHRRHGTHTGSHVGHHVADGKDP